MTRYRLLLVTLLPLGVLAWVLGWGWAGLTLVGMFLVAIGLGVVFPGLRLFGNYICRGDASRRRVALTFDDGPDSDSTPALLDLLRAEGVQAAFFCVGRRIESGRALAARMVREGHLVENHSFQHSNATNCFGTKRLTEELARAQGAIREATGVSPRFFRPPMGLSNPRVFRAAAANGLKVIGWTARGLDTRIREPERIIRRIMRRVQPGAILLLHDGNIPADRLVLTVRGLLAKLREQGYEIVRLDAML